jgi:hypothetical protein
MTLRAVECRPGDTVKRTQVAVGEPFEYVATAVEIMADNTTRHTYTEGGETRHLFYPAGCRDRFEVSRPLL